jgi:hypothetical protein
MVQASQFSVTIVCPACGSAGVVTWEKVGNERSLVSLSDGFHEQISTKKPYALELVCNSCGRHELES